MDEILSSIHIDMSNASNVQLRAPIINFFFSLDQHFAFICLFPIQILDPFTGTGLGDKVFPFVYGVYGIREKTIRQRKTLNSIGKAGNKAIILDGYKRDYFQK